MHWPELGTTVSATRSRPLSRPWSTFGKLTLTQAACTRADVDRLREHGWSDEQVVSAAQIIGYFNHLNRLADGLGIDLESDMNGTGPQMHADERR